MIPRNGKMPAVLANGHFSIERREAEKRIRDHLPIIVSRLKDYEAASHSDSLADVCFRRCSLSCRLSTIAAALCASVFIILKTMGMHRGTHL